MILPNIPDKTCAPIPLTHFPTRWQAVLWRNYCYFSLEKLASLLKCQTADLTSAAVAMGLPAIQPPRESWKQDGYTTILRDNWHLLPYEQIMELLDWDTAQFVHALREEDFLWGKLGGMKPDCVPVVYAPLTAAQENATALFRNRWQKYVKAEDYGYVEQPFAFRKQYRTFFPLGNKKSPFSLCFVHSYAASCGDVLIDVESRDPVPENLLKEYAAQGVNGIWFHALLYKLYPIAGSEEFSDGYQTRMENLKKIVARCKKYGIGLYLYLNEPRGMTDAFYQKNPDWRGVTTNPARLEYANCTSKGAVLKWMEEALYNVFKQVPDLGGAFMITMSENPTHCNAQHKKDQCPLCADRDGADLIADVAIAAERGIHRAAPEAKLLMSDWAWSEINFDHQTIFRKKVIDRLPKNVWYLCISEWGKEIHVGGVRNDVFDYSISQIGPSDEVREAIRYAREKGLKVAAKIQANNSWELSGVPYIPVPYLVEEHITNLKNIGVDGLMMSWTHGGYPGGNLALLHSTTDELVRENFHPEAAERICNALKGFSDAFRHFPFDVGTMYRSPVNAGPRNLLHLKNTGFKATMVGYPYDDLKGWRSVYPEDVFEDHFRMVTEGWSAALEDLKDAAKLILASEQDLYTEIVSMAQGAFAHLQCTYVQTCFIRRRDAGDTEGMKHYARLELENTLALYHLMRKDSRVGFECSNHYYYSLQSILEKIVNCESILEQLEK